MPGPENTYQSYGRAWANLSNSPFRLYKHWIHEGGISTPLIVHWPEGINDRNAVRHTPGYLPDIMATIVEATGASYPENWKGRQVDPAASPGRTGPSPGDRRGLSRSGAGG